MYLLYHIYTHTHTHIYIHIYIYIYIIYIYIYKTLTSKNGLRLFIVLLSSFLPTFLSNFNHTTYVSMGCLRNQNYKIENTFRATKLLGTIG